MRRAPALRCLRAPPAGPVGYGPHSATAKARLARERHEQQQQRQRPSEATTASAAASPSQAPRPLDVMENISLATNLSLRLSLANLPHPSQVRKMAYQSDAWRAAMVRLYRTILRLHNKTVAVSVDRSRSAGAASAVAAVTGVTQAEEKFLRSAAGSTSPGGCPSDTSPADPISPDDYLLRYLLTPEQREFGNRFVQGEFSRNRDADAMSGMIFYESWYQYVLQLASGVTARDMTEEERRLLTPDQKEKLKELRGAFTSLRAQSEPGYML